MLLLNNYTSAQNRYGQQLTRTNNIAIGCLNQHNLLSVLDKQLRLWEVVVAQLVEQSLPIPEVRGSNPVIGKIY